MEIEHRRPFVLVGPVGLRPVATIVEALHPTPIIARTMTTVDPTAPPSTTTTPRRRLPRPVRHFVLAFLALCALGGSWAVASPLMAVPDEPAHTIHAVGVASGQVLGERTEDGGWTEVVVPEYVAETYDLRCYAFNAAVSAECQSPVSSDDTSTEATTSAGSYDPLYYAIVGWPTLVLDGEVGLYAVRGMSVVLNAALLALAFVALMQLRNRSFAVVGFSVAVTPMVLFLVSGVNPNGMEISSAVMLFAWLTLLRQRADEGVPAHRIALVVVAAVAVANTRSIGILWLLVILVACMVDAELWRRLLRSVAFWVGAVVIGAGVAFNVVWTLSTASLEVTVPNPGVGTSFPVAFREMMFVTFENVQGYVGLLGWLDTPLPPTTVGLWGAAMLVLVLGGLVFGRGRAQWALAVLALAFVLVPAVVQGYGAMDYGFIWQARYVLALVCPLVVAGGVALDTAFPRALDHARARVLVGLVLVTLALMHVHAVLFNLKRYVVGLTDGWSKMVTAPEWAPPLGWEPWAVVVAVTCVVCVGLLLRAVRPDHLEVVQQPVDTAVDGDLGVRART